MNHPQEAQQLAIDMRNAEILSQAVVHYSQTAELVSVKWMLTDREGEYKLSEYDADVWIEEFTPFILEYSTALFTVLKLDIYRLLVTARRA